MQIFVTSDIHSFFTPFKEALDKAGFEDKEGQLLIICGDLYDRGNETIQLYKYLQQIKHKVLIRGNHEDLMLEMCERGYSQSHDRHNGTDKTADHFCKYFKLDEIGELYSFYSTYLLRFQDYFETKNYVFVHGWIPVKVVNNKSFYFGQCDKFEFDPNWRNSCMFPAARWYNGIDMAKHGFTIPDKTIVCGHWHCSYGHALDTGTSQFETDAIWEPYIAPGIMAIDRCTAHTGEVNVVVLEDDLLD